MEPSKKGDSLVTFRTKKQRTWSVDQALWVFRKSLSSESPNQKVKVFVINQVL